MPSPCPVCHGSSARALDSRAYHVTYYICFDCLNAWIIPKADPTAAPEVITHGAYPTVAPAVLEPSERPQG